MFDPKKANNDLNLLAPFFYRKLETALKEVHAGGYDLFVFEGWRSPTRQDFLYEQGRSEPGNVVTNARSWQSWHQFACACDLVGKINNRWTWDIDYDKPAEIMIRHGFEWLGNKGDRPHFQITGKLTIQEAKAITFQHGVQALWITINERISK